jgi:hypothetical protein
VQPLLEDIEVQQFDKGIVWNNDTGHIYHRRLNLTNNYYGVYVSKNTYDYFISDSLINGNTFAGIGMPANVGIAGFRFENVHCGFQPFGIYQEATPELAGNSIFLQEGKLDHVRFEAIGNAGIWCDVPFSFGATYKAQCSDLEFTNVGFNNNASYNVASAPDDYSVQLPLVDRIIKVYSGTYPFDTWHVQQMGSVGSIQVIDTTTTAADFTVDNGGTSRLMIGSNEHAAAVGAAVHYRAGFYYSAPGARGTSNRPNGSLTFLPMKIERIHTFDRIAVEVVTTPGSAGALIRLDVYDHAGGSPKDLIVDAGTVDATTTGVKTINDLAINLAPGWYFLAAVVEGAPTTLPVMRAIPPSSVVPGAPVLSTSLAHGAGWQQTGVTGALPLSASGVTATDTTIAVALRA